MKKYPLIGGSILAVVLLIFGSLTNVVGFQTVQSSNQQTIKEEISQKELLFQTILDVAKNKKIQKIIFNSEIRGSKLFSLNSRDSIFTPHVFTKKFLDAVYHMGKIFSRTLNPSMIHTMLERCQVNNQEIQKEINTIIEKDAKLNGEILQLSNSKCDCENENITSWNFPVLCAILFPLVTLLSILVAFVWGIFHVFLHNLLVIVANIGLTLNCFWIQ